MASTNLDLVRSIFAAWERGDFGSARWADPEIEYIFADGPEPGNWMGRGAMNEAWRGIASAWDDLSARVNEYRELDDNRVLVLYSITGRGKTSGIDAGRLQQHMAQVMHLHDGRVTRLVLYWDRDRALADLGVEE